MLTLGSSATPIFLGEFTASLASIAQFESSPFLAVAVSGGPDSLALAILAERWGRERGGEVRALTVDHRLRPESGDEIRQLAAWLSARGIRHEVLVWTGEKPRTGIQEAARSARYRLLGGWCRDHACLHLLTGHHRDDQIETHLIRRRAHSGPDGLAGMSAVRELADCRLLRPLLGVARHRLVAFLEAERQPFIRDPSNFDPAFERSRLRQGDGTPAGEVGVSRLLDEIRALGSTRRVRVHEGNTLLARYVSFHPAGFALCDTAMMSEKSSQMTERLLSAVTAAIGVASYPPRRERIARLREALGGAARRGHTLGGCRFIRWRERILVTRELARAPPPLRLRPGERTIWDRRFEIMTPQSDGGPFTIGYLGGYPGLAETPRLDHRMPQLRRERLPRLLFPVIPAVWDEEGIAAIPHLGYGRKEIADLPEVVFRPVTPLTQAGFAVV
ncbi:MAG: tRNA lysidine(34) synthetase TilS [Alphaproteobacteria bacterium]|nr:tRNA lysidine(34) synthetase TilS [Alphaproteobacteria bacterium]